ncbi:hypothetical protein SAMN02745120_0611 [Acetoanaerobium noterae]|uniref:Uncharacterized protein n=1 Tax=Acetoanaerobium noterae TaxID=745369 RepID=A0A1T5A194_9FIRM|nr:hypothetical protein [Acetoanaerobium noterae]SKB28423.1 hypothetical protein SAMN02745120_0611 [Acetoanaerobium noterae]
MKFLKKIKNNLLSIMLLFQVLISFVVTFFLNIIKANITTELFWLISVGLIIMFITSCVMDYIFSIGFINIEKDKNYKMLLQIFDDNEIRNYLNESMEIKEDNKSSIMMDKCKIYEEYLKKNCEYYKSETVYPILISIIAVVIAIPEYSGDNSMQVGLRTFCISLIAYAVMLMRMARDYWENELVKHKLKRINNINLDYNKKI